MTDRRVRGILHRSAHESRKARRMDIRDRKGQPVAVGDTVILCYWNTDIPKYLVGSHAEVREITRRGKIIVAATHAEIGTRTCWSRDVQRVGA